MRDGNTCFIVIWIDDTAIVKKPLSGQTYYFVADAVSGAPVAKANVEFFGWRQVSHNSPQRFEVLTKQFAEYSDAQGQVIPEPQEQPQEYQWLITARTQEGRFAYLGFTGVWYGRWYDAEYNATKVFAITDRPVYRPAQPVKYKFWVRQSKYDMGETSRFAESPFTVEIHNPKGEKVVSETKTADAFGGIEGEYKLPADAALGVYGLQVIEPNTRRSFGGSSFRVEEYKKPEFEVTVDAPTKPVMLGEKITATIKAKYYFGAPVTNAKVKYKVYRTSYSERWYPFGIWDWLYGPGYWWFAGDYDWYPGWSRWGCARPMPFWWPHAQQPPELVAEQEVAIGPDGTQKVEIDTAVAKAIHPDQDHTYSITAEVVDASRRTIVGSGTVLVARQPFKVYAWLDRGYYRIGDTVHAHFSARTLDGKPVHGHGELTLLVISYPDRKQKPLETPVQTWQIDTNEEGAADQQITAAQAGQYRLSYKLTSASHTIEGGYLFTIIGEGFDSAQFRFNHVELIPDKREYAPGQKVKLQINTDRAGGTVLLFVRPANGIYLLPKVIRLSGKSTVEEIDVAQKDMPNFFVEAVSVADGRVYSDCKEIVVPPEKRVLNVAVLPSKKAYKPGEKAKVNVKLTDLHGEPFVGSTVVAIYDKSLEYISGGSNVPEIKAFFWKWRRQHNPHSESNLQRWSQNLLLPNTTGMGDLGIFGHTVVEEVSRDKSKMLAGVENMAAQDAAMPMAAPAAMAAEQGGRDVLRKQCRRSRTRRQGNEWQGRTGLWDQERFGIGCERRRGTERTPDPAHHPHEIRRHSPLGRRADDQRRRHGRGFAQHAREPDHLADQGLGDGPGYEGRPRRNRRGNAQGPHRSAGGPAVLRTEGRSRPLGRRSQLPQGKETSHGTT